MIHKEIARNLVITETTVKVHVKAILRKIRVKNRTQAAIWAMKFARNGHSLLEPPRPLAMPQGVHSTVAGAGRIPRSVQNGGD
jgi:two-component system nitrate/nitrite response regulator NarL